METGKNILITGATSGIGEACARLLADNDSTLVIVGRNEEKLKMLEYELPGNILPIRYDLSDLVNLKSIYEICRENEIKLDGMVYSAGMDGTWPVKVNSITAMQQMMNVNCFAFVELGKYFYSKRFSHDGASIVAISSLASLTAEVGMVAYSASKAALNSAVRTMAKEFVRRKIRVNAILPGGVSSPMAVQKGLLLEGVSSESQTIPTKNEQPLGMIPTEIIAEQVRYLLSDKALYTTGELITVSGGRTY